MNCTACGHANRDTAKFCEECAAPLKRVCSSCSAELRPTAKFCDECGAPTATGRPQPRQAAEAGGARKVVTVVFADLAGSTALHERVDAESARRLMERYYQTLRTAVESHGGTVVKLLGDGVMAAFGVPQVAEDDAIRAVRAGVAMQEAFRALVRGQGAVLAEIGLRVAVNTGEVVVTGANDDVVGDPVNVAARLQQEARDGDVVVGEATRRLVSSLVTLDALGSFSLKGRSEPVAAYRVVSLERPVGVAAVPFVGRDGELVRLTAAFDTAVAAPATKLAVLLGSAGLGKSRLIDELGRRLGERASVLHAHCEAAGGATFAPVAEALREFLGIDDGAGGDALRDAVEAALPEDAVDRAQIVAGVSALLAASPASPEETFFVVRRLLAAFASRKPVLLVIDDLQWAEPLLLDLVEHLVQWGRDVPLLVLVGARPELRDARSALTMPGGVVADVITLGGLDAGAAMRLAANVIGAADLPAAVAAKVLASSEGNPLFVGELVRMLVEEGALEREGDRWTVGAGLAEIEMPPTIHALLAARIERLRPEDCMVLERAAVVGRQFSRGALAELLPRELGDLDARLESLRRSELVERDSGWFLGEPALRFHHQLIRDAAYRRVLKETRAELHARLADWIEARVGDSVEHDETIGRHLEQAHQNLGELGPVDEEGRLLGERAAQRLAAAGRRALARDDVSLAANLLGRALDRLEPGDPTRADLSLDWCEALLAAGDVGRAATAIDELDVFAADSTRLRAWHTCFAGQLTALTAPEALHTTADAVAAAAQQLASLGDEAGEAKAHFVHAQTLARLGKVGACEAALDRALAAARHAGDRRRANAVLAGAPLAALWGPSPVTRASGRCLDVVRVLRITQGAPAVEAVALSCQGVLEALRGRTDAARRMIASSRQMIEELGITHRLFETDVFSARIDLLEGKAVVAERCLRVAYDGLRDLGLGIDAAQAGALLARSLLAQDRAAEAEALSHESEALAGDDLQAAISWRGVRAEALARRGEIAASIELAQAAVAIAAATDALLYHAEARLALAAALRAAGRLEEALAEERHARALWEDKGATLLAERAERDGTRTDPAANAPMERVAPNQSLRRCIRANAATAVSEALDRAFADRDPDAIATLFNDAYREIDHPTGHEWGVDGAITSLSNLMRSSEPYMHHESLATLGDALALGRRRTGAAGSHGSRMDVGAYDRAEEVIVSQVDDRGKLVCAEVFASDRLSEAIECLYARYAEQLPAGPSRTRMAAVARSSAGLGAVLVVPDQTSHPFAPSTELIDHRLVGVGTLRGAEAVLQVIRGLNEFVDDISWRGEDVLALTDDGLLQRSTNLVVDRYGGGSLERGLIGLMLWDAAGLIERLEIFDDVQQDAALARFDELTGATTRSAALPRADDRVRPNRASAANSRLEAAVRAHDIERVGSLLSENLTTVDHPSGSTWGRRGELDSAERMFRIARLAYRIPVIATLGDSLGLFRRQVRAAGTTGGSFDVGHYEMDHVAVAQVDGDGRFERFEVFASDRLGDAIACLYERYGEHLSDGSQRARTAMTARAIRAMSDAAFDAERVTPTLVPDIEVVDHRILGTWNATGVDAVLQQFHSLSVVADAVVLRDEDVLVLTPEALLTRRTHCGNERVGGGAYERAFLMLLTFAADGRLARVEWFDVGQEAYALATLDALTGSTTAVAATAFERPFENAAKRLMEGPLRGCWMQRDWNALAQRIAADFRHSDRRRMVQLELDRDGYVEMTRALDDMRSAGISMEPLATRGDRLVLYAIRVEVAEGDVGPSDIESLNVMEVDERGELFVANVRFDADDLDAAYAEIDARYEAGEGSACPTAVRLNRAFLHAITTADWEPVLACCAPAIVEYDHRRLAVLGTTEGAENWVRNFRLLAELAPDTTMRLDHLRGGARGFLFQMSWQGTRDGGRYEIPVIGVIETDGADRVARADIYDVEQVEEARARFAALGTALHASSYFENVAARVSGVLFTSYVDRDWERFEALFAAEFRHVDRRRIAQLQMDREQYFAFTHELDHLSIPRGDRELIATRGERLSLQRFRFEFAGGDVGASEIEVYTIVEADAGGACATLVRFDPDDLDAAYAELDARFAAGEALEYAQAGRGFSALFDRVNRRDWEALRSMLGPAYVTDDHRVLGWGKTLADTETFLRSQQALVELSPDARYRIDHLRLSHRASFSQITQTGTRAGGAFENSMLNVATWNENGRPGVAEIYDLDQLSDASARFDELRAPSDYARPAALEIRNAATSTMDRWQVAFEASVESDDWDSMRRLCAPAMRFVDRRRLALLDGDAELMIASARERARVGAHPDLQPIGSAGDRIALWRMIWSGGPADGRFEVEYLAVAEVDASGLLLAIFLFDVDDADDALREAWARWAAIDPIAARWVSLAAASTDSFNARSLRGMNSLFAEELVVDDHRRTGFGSIEGREAYLDAVAVLFDLTPDTKLEIGWHWPAYARHAAIAAGRRTGTIVDGGPFESDFFVLYEIADGLVSRMEIYEVDHLDEALARFAALRPDPLRIPSNAATRAGELCRAAAVARDWKTLRELVRDDFVYEDRGRRSLVRGGIEEWIASLDYFLGELGAVGQEERLATAGENLMMYRVAWRSAAAEPSFDLAKISITEVDETGKIRSVILFDDADRVAASEAMWDSYAQSEADRFPSFLFELTTAWNAHDLDRLERLLPDDYYFHDRRRTGAGLLDGAKAVLASNRAIFDLSHDVRTDSLYTAAGAAHGLVFVARQYGTNQVGGDFESVFVLLGVVRDGRPVGHELFEIDDLDEALAHFEQLGHETST